MRVYNEWLSGEAAWSMQVRLFIPPLFLAGQTR
jgi:hypothetical protein